MNPPSFSARCNWAHVDDWSWSCFQHWWKNSLSLLKVIFISCSNHKFWKDVPSDKNVEIRNWSKWTRSILNILVTFKSIHLFHSSSLESRTDPCGTHPATLNKTSTFFSWLQYSLTAAELVTSRTAVLIPSGSCFKAAALISLNYYHSRFRSYLALSM